MYGNEEQIFEYFAGTEPRITARAAVAIVGRRFVKFAPGGADQAPVITTCDADDPNAIGVAAWSVGAGEDVVVTKLNNVPGVITGAAITAPSLVKIGAGGTVVPLGASDRDLAVGWVYVDKASGVEAPVYPVGL